MKLFRVSVNEELLEQDSAPLKIYGVPVAVYVFADSGEEAKQLSVKVVQRDHHGGLDTVHDLDTASVDSKFPNPTTLDEIFMPDGNKHEGEKAEKRSHYEWAGAYYLLAEEVKQNQAIAIYYDG